MNLDHGKPIELGEANKKLERRKIIFEKAQKIIPEAFNHIADAKTYYTVDKNAYIFDINLIGRYFKDGSVEGTNYEGATHFLVIEGAHIVNWSGFTENMPTVILVPVRKEAKVDEYILVGDPKDASTEWPEAFKYKEILNKNRDKWSPESPGGEVIFIVKPAITDQH